MNDQTITITLKDGQIGVNGPIENKLFCLGLLELAKDLIIKYDPAAIQLVRPS